jgi:opacity protein-like surface antigen
VNANMHEWSAAYIFRMPLGRIAPFVEAGVGGLSFDPRNAPDASSQTRVAFVYGAGADLNFSHNLFARAQYRGSVYKSPTFNLLANNGADRTTHLAEPSIGLGLRF